MNQTKNYRRAKKGDITCRECEHRAHRGRTPNVGCSGKRRRLPTLCVLVGRDYYVRLDHTCDSASLWEGDEG